jgi:hypothetical protein
MKLNFKVIDITHSERNKYAGGHIDPFSLAENWA